MSYTLNVANNSGVSVVAPDGTTIAPQQQWSSGTLGSANIAGGQIGNLVFTDIGDRHIPGDSGETWGVLIAFQGAYMVARYEGAGSLNAVINDFNQVHLSGMDIRSVSFSAFN